MCSGFRGMGVCTNISCVLVLGVRGMGVCTNISCVLVLGVWEYVLTSHVFWF